VIAPNALALITAFPRVSRKRAIWSTWRGVRPERSNCRPTACPFPGVLRPV